MVLMQKAVLSCFYDCFYVYDLFSICQCGRVHTVHRKAFKLLPPRCFCLSFPLMFKLSSLVPIVYCLYVCLRLWCAYQKGIVLQCFDFHWCQWFSWSHASDVYLKQAQWPLWPDYIDATKKNNKHDSCLVSIVLFTYILLALIQKIWIFMEHGLVSVAFFSLVDVLCIVSCSQHMVWVFMQILHSVWLGCIQ